MGSVVMAEDHGHQVTCQVAPPAREPTTRNIRDYVQLQMGLFSRIFTLTGLQIA